MKQMATELEYMREQNEKLGRETTNFKNQKFSDPYDYNK
jgi:hypothetical protein